MSHHRTYVLDTSVLLAAPDALTQFDEHDVVLPLVVVKELEAKRKDPLLGFSAREALRRLDELAETGDINEGVESNGSGGTVRIEINHVTQAGLPDALVADRSNDTRILAVASNLAAEGGSRVVLVSKDISLRLLAKTLGLASEGYRNDLVVVDQAYTGVVHADVPADVVSSLYADRTVDFDTGPFSDFADLDGTPVNTGVVLSGPGRGSALAVLTPHKQLRLLDSDVDVFGVRPRSVEQKFALHHLMNPDTQAVSLGGKAGTGKTFLALASGLEQVLEQGRYKKVIVFRPLFAVGGQQLGYLPGTAEEKMSPWGAAVFDALAAMTTKDVVDEVLARDMLDVLPLTHIRGRSLTDAFVIVDEAQSLEKPVLLTALTRLGENSKIVLSHDVAQRDNLRVGRHDGIAAVVERLKGEALFAHTTFTRSERGPVAEMATRLLDDMG